MKFKRLLSGVLAAAMAISSISLSAFGALAADSQGYLKITQFKDNIFNMGGSYAGSAGVYGKGSISIFGYNSDAGESNISDEDFAAIGNLPTTLKKISAEIDVAGTVDSAFTLKLVGYDASVLDDFDNAWYAEQSLESKCTTKTAYVEGAGTYTVELLIDDDASFNGIYDLDVCSLETNSGPNNPNAVLTLKSITFGEEPTSGNDINGTLTITAATSGGTESTDVTISGAGEYTAKISGSNDYFEEQKIYELGFFTYSGTGDFTIDVTSVTLRDKTDNSEYNFTDIPHSTGLVPASEYIAPASGSAENAAALPRRYQYDAGTRITGDDSLYMESVTGTGAQSIAIAGTNAILDGKYAYVDSIEYTFTVKSTGEVTTEPVDYTALDEAIAEAEAVDTSIYTDETVSALTEALEAAKTLRENSDATQADVDAAAKALAEAIEGLEESPTASSDVYLWTGTYSRSSGLDTTSITDNMTVTSSSGYITFKGIDLSNMVDPYVEVAFDANGSNDTLYVATSAWTSVIGSSTDALAKASLADFKSTTSFIITTNNKSGTYGTITSVKFYDAAYVAPIDYTALDEAITAGEAVDTSSYTDATVTALTDAIAAAKAVKENADATQVDVDAAAKAITDAIAGLVELEPSADVYTWTGTWTRATGLVDPGTANGITVENTGGGWQMLVKDLDISNMVQPVLVAECTANKIQVWKGQGTSGDKISTGAESGSEVDLTEYKDATVLTLSLTNTGSITSVKIYDAAYVVPLDTAELDEAIAEAEAVDTTKYTADSVKALTDAITAAQDVKTNADATQADVDAAAKAITDAIAGLVELEPSADVYTWTGTWTRATGLVDPGTANGITVENTGGGWQMLVKDLDISNMVQPVLVAECTANKIQVWKGQGTSGDKISTGAESGSEVDLTEYKDATVLTLSLTNTGSITSVKIYDAAYVAPIDYTALDEAITAGEAVDTSSYTDATVTALTDAIAAAKAVKENADATQADVDAAAQAISDAIAGLAVKLNYTALDEAITNGQAVNKTNYTDDSVKALTDAITAAQAVKNNVDATQADVDAAAKAITDAIDNLVEKDLLTVYIQSDKDLKSTSVDFNGKGDYSATVTLNNNYWYGNLGGFALSPYPTDGPDFEIDVNSMAIRTGASTYTLIPTTGNKGIVPSADTIRTDLNGLPYTFTKGEVYAQSEDGQIILTAYDNSTMRLLVNGSMAKISTITYNFTVREPSSESADTAALEAAITVGKDLDSSKYTESTYAVLTSAIESGEKVLANTRATQDDVDAAAEAIKSAIAGLIEAPKVDPASEPFEKIYYNQIQAYTTLLSGTVGDDIAGATRVRITFDCSSDASYNPYASIEFKMVAGGAETGYNKFTGTDGSYAGGTTGWIETLELSKALAAGESYELTGFTASWEKLTDYVYGITRIEFIDANGKVINTIVGSSLDYTALDAAIADGEAVDTSLYTDESVKALTDAVAAGKAVKENEAATQDDIDAAVKAITEAIAALETKPIVITGSVTGTIFVSDEEAETEMTVVAVSADGTEVSTTATSMGTYVLEGLVAGDYTLTISGGKYAERTYEMTVEAGDNALDVYLNPLGDINGDGKVTTADVGMANSHAKGVSTLEGYQFVCGDVNGDGSITTSDVGMINSHAKGVKTLW